VLLLVFAGLGVLVAEDEVNLELISMQFEAQECRLPYLVGSTALVGTKHDNIGSAVRELFLVELLVLLEKLEVRTTANQRV
jgi:hypothetical protein